MKIHTETFGGNYHSAANRVNELGWAEWLIQFNTVGNYTIGVFKMPADMVRKIRSDNPSWMVDPGFDDPKSKGE